MMLQPLASPSQLKARLPLSPAGERQIEVQRETIRQIIAREDPRALCVVGPCSIHDTEAAYTYAKRLHQLAEEVSSSLYLVMRVYGEKARTTVGWKGMVYDPDLSGRGNLDKGLWRTRELMLEITHLELPIATEFLHPVSPPYYEDLVSWGCVGARTSASQVHREMISGLSLPIGIKHPPTGNIEIAIEALAAATTPQSFFSLDQEGVVCQKDSQGNPHSHIVLRGSRQAPNYDVESVTRALNQLAAHGFPPRLLVDCSHDNCRRDHRWQEVACRNVVHHMARRTSGIFGFMLESYLEEGREAINNQRPTLSITDPCIGWEETERLILWTAKTLQARSDAPLHAAS